MDTRYHFDIHELFVQMRQLESRHLKTILPILRKFHNETEDFSEYHLRSSLKPFFATIVTIYLIILLSSVSGNVFMANHILKNRMRRTKSQQVTFSMLLGNCFNDIIIKNLIVLPFSLLILLTIHWTQGSFTCYMFPMLQDSCFYANSITFLLIFYNRYTMAAKVGLLGDINEVCNHSFGLSAFWSLLIAWIISLIGVLPYTIYIEFIDLAQLLPHITEGIGFCVVNLDGNIQEYIRCLFISFYVIPIALVAYFHTRTTTLMRSWPGYETISFEISLLPINQTTSARVNVRSSPEDAFIGTNRFNRAGNRLACESGLNEDQKRSIQVIHQPNVWTEKGSQRVLMIMFAVHSICLLPINILRMSKHVVIETHENSFAFDVVFVICVAIQFSSSAVQPILYHFWTSGNIILGVGFHNYLYTERGSISVNRRRSSAIISNEQITTTTEVSGENARKVDL